MPQARTLTASEVERLLDAVKTGRHGHRNQLILQFMYWAGMRVGEVAALHVCDVVDRSGQVRREIRLEAQQTKGRHGRTVCMPEKLQHAIATYLQTYRLTTSPFLFISQKRSAFTADTLQGIVTTIYRRLDMEGCSSHSGRRTFITNLASKGVSVRVLQELAGHRHLATTQRYIDVNDEMKRSAVELV